MLRKLLAVIFTISFVGFFILFIEVHFFRLEHRLRPLDSEDDRHRTGLDPRMGHRLENVLPEEMACKIPVLDPFDPEFLAVVEPETKSRPACMDKSKMKFRTDLDSNLLRVPGHEDYWNRTACCYFVFTRGRDDMFIRKNQSVCHPITEDRTRIPPSHEFISVKCTGKSPDVPAYADSFGFVHLKPEVERRAKENRFRARMGNKDQLSIVILGLDSVSEMNYQRFMPRTRNFLLRNLSAIEFLGRNKIHESTFANMGPTLTGWTNDELTSHVKCWPHPPETYFDPCPFIWKEYAERGYRTVYGEDSIHRSIWLDSTLIGFQGPIGDYDFRTLIRGMELMEGKDGCFSHQASPDILIDSVAKAAWTFRDHDRPYFHFTWITAFTHESARNTEHVDEPVFDLLQTLTEENLLNNTVFILMSDHGMTFGKYVEQEQGQLESRMPMLNIVLPVWFEQKYSAAVQNLRLNANRLSTPFDLHEMLSDLLDPSETISKPAIERRETESYAGSRGISLFLPIPLNRTCAAAAIDDHWCICWRRIQIQKPEQNAQVVKAVNFSLSVLNAKIRSFSICAKLRLEAVILARQLNPESSQFTEAFEGVRKYEVVFRVTPSGGIFEATVVLQRGRDPKMGGPISRINAYKSQGNCIDTTRNGTLEVKSMCFCEVETGLEK